MNTFVNVTHVLLSIIKNDLLIQLISILCNNELCHYLTKKKLYIMVFLPLMKILIFSVKLSQWTGFIDIINNIFYSVNNLVLYLDLQLI